MTALQFLENIRIDGEQVRGVVQATIDAEKTTLIYDVQKADGETAQRVVTVETGAVTVG
jgi:hypothetical protein